MLGRALQKVGRKEEGEVELDLAQQLSQREQNMALAKTYSTEGTELLQGGQIGQAAAKLEEAVGLNPEDPVAQYNYAVILMLQNKLDEAIARFRTTLRLRPDDANSYYSMGRALLAKGRSADAAASLQEAVRLMPNDARAHNLLAVALAGVGEFSRATEELQGAHRLEPNSVLFEENLFCLESRLQGCVLIP
jgi:Flp pilus assembly protein TadD